LAVTVAPGDRKNMAGVPGGRVVSAGGQVGREIIRLHFKMALFRNYLFFTS